MRGELICTAEHRVHRICVDRRTQRLAMLAMTQCSAPAGFTALQLGLKWQTPSKRHADAQHTSLHRNQSKHKQSCSIYASFKYKYSVVQRTEDGIYVVTGQWCSIGHFLTLLCGLLLGPRKQPKQPACCCLSSSGSL